jgi:tRNA 2-thiouridine synthesizing protein A
MGCGDLVLALRLRLQKLEPGAVLKVTARDPAAPEDLPAWCRLTGHRLVWASHPEYLIERKRGS